MSCRVVFSVLRLSGCNQSRSGRNGGQLQSTQVPGAKQKRQARHQGRYGKCKSGGIWKSRRFPAPLGMALFPRLLTCSDICILRVLDVLALWLLLLVLAGLASWPGPMLLAQCMCACTAVRVSGPPGATRWALSKSRDAEWYLFAGSCRLVPPGHCLQPATWPLPRSLLAAACDSTLVPLPPPSRCRHTHRKHTDQT